MPYHPPVIVGNVTYDLAHLDPVTFDTPSIKLNRPIRTRCWFTTHTFTAQAPDAYPGPVMLDEGRRPRVFCPDRYALSHHLPATVCLLANPDLYVWEGGHERNWLHRAEVAVPDQIGGMTTYQVFFALKRAKRGGDEDVEMVVESAYAHDPLRTPKVLGRTKIAGLLAATIEGRALHTQRRGR